MGRRPHAAPTLSTKLPRKTEGSISQLTDVDVVCRVVDSALFPFSDRRRAG